MSGGVTRISTIDGADDTAHPDVFELAAIGMVIVDLTGCFRRVNAAFAALLGRSPEELIGASFDLVTSPDDVERSRTALRELATGAIDSARFEKRYVRPDGSVVWVDLSVRPVLNSDGEVVACLTQGVDITARQKLEQERHRSTEDAHRLAVVARVTPSPVVIADPDGRIQWVNDAFTRLTGYERNEIVGSTYRDLQGRHAVEAPELADFFATVLRGESADQEFRLTAKDGRAYWARIQLRSVIEDGEVTHVVGVAQDVTKRRQAEERIRVEKARVEALARALAQEKELLARVISAVPQMVYLEGRRSTGTSMPMPPT